MSHRPLSKSQKQILENAIRRLRQSADQIEHAIRSGDNQELSQASGLLHASDTQIRWVRQQGSIGSDPNGEDPPN